MHYYSMWLVEKVGERWQVVGVNLLVFYSILYLVDKQKS